MKIVRCIFLAALSLCFAGCSGDSAPTASFPQLVFAEAYAQDLTLTRDLPGRVSALAISEVRPQVNGIILERLFEEGADVVKGQSLYQIDPALYQAAYNTAQAALTEAEARLTALALREKRQQKLAQAKAISLQDLDNTVSEHGQAVAQVAKAKAELESAAVNLAYTLIKAPISGRIGASAVTPGALVTANQAEPLATIQQTDRMYVDITQSSAELIALRRALAQGNMAAGDKVAVRLRLEDGSPYTRLGDANKEGEVSWLLGNLLFSDISVSPSTGSVTLRAVFDNPDALLLPGMYVTATIEEGILEQAILIPQASVMAGGESGHSVFVLKELAGEPGLFEVERRSIRLSRPYGRRWIVSEGLKAGEMVVVEGLQKVGPGDKALAEPQAESGL